MTIITGGAHTSTRQGVKRAEAGDQYQTSEPDYSGEVCMTKFETEDKFISRYRGYIIVRPVKGAVASSSARSMIRACNNINIGYLYGGKGMVCQGGSNTTSTNTPCVTDCSGLVSQCVSEAIGSSIYAATSGLVSTLVGTGQYNQIGPFQSYGSTPVYDGDVLVDPGHHTDMVVGGNARSGENDTLLSQTASNMNGTSTKEVTAVREGYNIEKDFEPRRYAPDSSQSTYNFFEQEYGTTENGSYAWGRFSEICKEEASLSRGDPRRWFVNTEDGYKRGVSPSLGAVMCFTNIYDTSDPGYVCIVENVTDDYIYVSQYTIDKKPKFKYSKMTRKDGSWDMDLNNDGTKEFVFQGFIYSPVIDTYYAAGSRKSAGAKSYIETFIDTAKGQVGEGPEFTILHGGISNADQAWSGAFVRAVAARSGGILGTIIPDTTSCSSIGAVGVASDMGTWLDGPYLGGRPNPQIGDIALFRTSDIKYRLRYGADKAGIVVEVKSNGADLVNGEVKYAVKVVMGDCAGKVATKSYSNLTASLSGLFRPNWDRVDSISVAPESRQSVYGMYTQGTSIEDACLRDLKYASYSNGKLKPSIKPTGIKLCAINYTGMLANMYGLFAEMSEYSQRREDQANYNPNNLSGGIIPDSVVDDSNMGSINAQIGDGNVQISGSGSVSYDIQALYGSGLTHKVVIADNAFKVIYTTLKDFLGNSAGAIGIMGNIEIESGHDTSAGDAAGAVGLCQWMNYKGLPGGRRDQMIAKCGSNWKTNLEGQLAFLMDELNGGFSSAKTVCMSVPETLEGAYEASDKFMVIVEGPAKQEINGPNRRVATKAVWSLIKGAER